MTEHVHKYRARILRANGWEFLAGYYCKCGKPRPWPTSPRDNAKAAAQIFKQKDTRQ